MTDAEMIEHIRALKPVAWQMLLGGDAEGIEKRGSLLYITNSLIIEAAWGPRRVSSRTRGMELSAYPKEVGAGLGMWLAWLDRDKDYVSIVIAKKKAQARIDAALGRMSVDPEMATNDPGTALSQEEIDDLLAERAELRAARQFADADKIRDYLVANGVQVADQKVSA